MLHFNLWKNEDKKQKQHPDYIVKDSTGNKVGIAFSNKTKSDVKYISVTIKE